MPRRQAYRRVPENYSPARLAEIPEAPLVCPTAEEFEDPCSYIESLKRGGTWAEAGMIRIRPPAGWPRWKLGLVADDLMFEPRQQELHKLRHRAWGVNEVFRSFVEQTQRIHDKDLALPVTVEDESEGIQSEHAVDLYQLYLQVSDLGGKAAVLSESDWISICKRLLLPADKSIPAQLNRVYRRIFETDAMHAALNSVRENSTFNLGGSGAEFRSSFCSRNRQRFSERKWEEDLHLRKKTSSATVVGEVPPISCPECWNELSKKDKLQSCCICGRTFHALCFRSTFKPTWAGGADGLICSDDCSYGFGNGPAVTLRQYRRYAAEFKAAWIDEMRVQQTKKERESPVRWQDLESQFWQVIEEPTRAVHVSYGSDLDTSKVGSGFPRPRDSVIGDDDSSVLNPWNLNLFPRHRGSLLKYLSNDINGISIPWLYCGSLFAAFCYHVEDLHMMSINYMHVGDGSNAEGKIWYSAPPGEGALLFESALRSAVPRLFDAQPDLGHHIVTMVSPVELIDRGAKIFRTVQRPGDFIVTLPQSYHGGFSLGYNIAEAVNFFTPDCLPWMRSAVQTCRFYRRQPVFSLTELLVTIAGRMRFHGDLTGRDARIVAEELKEVHDDESQYRWLVVRSLAGFFDVVDDICVRGQDCSSCMQSCFLSVLQRTKERDLFCMQCVVENPEMFATRVCTAEGIRPYRIQYYEELTTVLRLVKLAKRHRLG